MAKSNNSKYPITTGGKTNGKYTIIFNVEDIKPFFLEIIQAIIMPGINDIETATIAIKPDNFKASISRGFSIYLFSIFLKPCLAYIFLEKLLFKNFK